MTHLDAWSEGASREARGAKRTGAVITRSPLSACAVRPCAVAHRSLVYCAASRRAVFGSKQPCKTPCGRVIHAISGSRPLVVPLRPPPPLPNPPPTPGAEFHPSPCTVHASLHLLLTVKVGTRQVTPLVCRGLREIVLLRWTWKIIRGGRDRDAPY